MKINKLLIGIIVAILVISIGVGIYFVLSDKTNEINKQVSDTHEHIYVEATCESPKICSICGKTEGEPLPHTTNFGKCTICGNLQNEELINDISNNLMSVHENMTNCSTQISAANINYPNDCFIKFSSVSTDLTKNDIYLEKIIELCGEFEELKMIKERCNNLINLNIYIDSSDYKALKEFLENYNEYLLNIQEIFQNMKEIVESYI